MARIKTLWSEFKSFAFKGNMIDLAVAVVIGAAFSGVINALVADIIMPGIGYVVTAARETSEIAANTAKKAAGAIGATSQPSTEPATEPATAPSTEPSTQPATRPVAIAVATGAGAAPPDVTQKIAFLEGEVAQLKSAAAAPPPAPPAPPADKAPNTKAVDFTWKIGEFKVGDFIGQIINFLLVAFAVFVFIVKLIGTVMKKAGGTPAPSEPTTKECPLCLSVIPIKAKRCAHCAADLPVPT